MRIKLKALSIIWKGLILFLVTRSLMVGSGLLGAGLRIRFFVLFPSLACTLIMIYYALAFAWNIWYIWEKDKVTFAPFFKHGVMLAGVASFLMVRFLLGDVGSYELTLNNSAFLLYYVVPAMVLVDWLLFDVKGQMSPWEMTGCLVIPLLYLILIWVSVEGLHHNLWANVAAGEGAYPYVFLDIRVVGLGGIVLFLAAVVVAYIVAAFLLYGIDQLLTWPKRKRLDWEADLLEEEDDEE